MKILWDGAGDYQIACYPLGQCESKEEVKEAIAEAIENEGSVFAEEIVNEPATRIRWSEKTIQRNEREERDDRIWTALFKAWPFKTN